jgi:DNA-binding NtrC family response regulator
VTHDRLTTPKYTDVENARPREVPGLVVVFARQQARAVPLPITGGSLELGREHPALAALPDPHISRRHLRVAFDGHRFLATDLHTSNGTVVDGAPLRPGTPREVSQVIRVGETLLVPSADLRALQEHGVRVGAGSVGGPALRETLCAAESAARTGRTLLIIGESGTGKEEVARAFHAAGPGSQAPLVAVRCSALPQGNLDEVLSGRIRAAHGGTLLLEDVAELSGHVQANLLHVIERNEILGVRGDRPHKVDVRICLLGLRDLRVDVEAGRLRDDLYYRVATPRVEVPPLRARPEEVAWLLLEALQAAGCKVPMHVSLVEACLMRPWPGNLRELLSEGRAAAQAAVLQNVSRVEACHMSPTAGAGRGTPSEPKRAPASQMRARIMASLERCNGNASAAARELGVHRTQFRRWLERYAIDPRSFTSETPDGQS